MKCYKTLKKNSSKKNEKNKSSDNEKFNENQRKILNILNLTKELYKIIIILIKMKDNKMLMKEPG